MPFTRDDHNGIVYEGNRSWGDVDKIRIPWVGHANWHDLDTDKKTTWKWPHHVVVDGGELSEQNVYQTGKLRLHSGGITSFMTYAAQSRTEIDAQSLDHGRTHIVDDLERDPDNYAALNTLLEAARGERELNEDELEDVVKEVSKLLNTSIPSGAKSDCIHAAELEGEAPDWVQIAETGQWKGHPEGPEIVTEEHLRSALATFKRHYKAKDTALVVDYHHQSAVARMKKGPSAPAAGWIHDMELRNDGEELWARVQWNDPAKRAITEGEYRYLSPVYRWDGMDPVTGDEVPMQITSVALTNTPFIKSLEALNEQAGAMDGTGVSARKGTGSAQEEDMDLIKELANAAGKEPDVFGDALGLEAGEAEDEDVAEAVLNTAQAEPEKQEVLPEDLLGALGLEDGSGKENAIKEVRKLKLDTVGESVRNKLGLEPDADEEAVCNAIDELQEEKHEQKVDQLVENAISEGKVQPAKEETLRRIARDDPEAARELIDEMDRQVSHAQERGGDATRSGELTDNQKQVAKQLGYSEEEYRKKVL